MARGYNRVLLIGNLTRDPELRYTPNNTAVADMGVAVNRTYQDGDGNEQDDTTFVDVTAWGRQAENCSQYLEKGSPIFVDGRLTFDSWEQDDGQKRSKLKVTASRIDFLGGSSNNDNAEVGTAEVALDDVEAEDDDVPF